MTDVLMIEQLEVKRNNKVNLKIDEPIEFLAQDKVAILGENGAGKSTLIDAILGEINYRGKINKRFGKENCGIVFQKNAYNPYMKVSELVQLALRLNKEEATQFFQQYELEELKNKLIEKLSGGEAQRLTLGIVLEKQNDVYFFDELTSGLDYKKRLGVLSQLKERTANKMVFNVTHYFDELENWATKILMLKKGRLVFFGSIEAFFATFKHYTVVKVDEVELRGIAADSISLTRMTDTGDGVAFICDKREDQAAIEAKLKSHDMAYKVIKQNIYTTYLVADLMHQLDTQGRVK